MLYKYIFSLILALFIGTSDTYSQAPSASVANFAITDQKAWKVSFSYSVPTSADADSAIIVMSTLPIDSIVFLPKSNGIGSYVSPLHKVIPKVKNGSQATTVKALAANTTYYFALVSFNKKSTTYNYRKTNQLIQSIKTLGKTKGTYYDALDTNRNVFLTQLTSLLKNHTFLPYVDFRDLVPELYERDTFIRDTSFKYVICSYSDRLGIYLAPFSFAKSNFNREHTLPKNWMNFKFQSNDSLELTPEGADYHNLSLTEANVNSARSDYAFDKVTANVVNYGKAKLNNSSTFSQRRFEPQDRYKGDAARCVMNQMVTYNGVANKRWGLRQDLKSDAAYQVQSILKSWALADTPDNDEIARNECIAALQGNRNPFIDFPEWVDCINFDDLTQIKTCPGLKVGSGSSTLQLANSDHFWDVWYYSYAEHQMIIKYYLHQPSGIQIAVYNMLGQQMLSKDYQGNTGENSHWLDTETMPKGTYLMHIRSENMEKSFLLTKD